MKNDKAITSKPFPPSFAVQEEEQRRTTGKAATTPKGKGKEFEKSSSPSPDKEKDKKKLLGDETAIDDETTI